MLDSFLITTRLKITYSVNAFFKTLKRTPLIKKIIPADIYSKGWIKTLGFIYLVIKELFEFFLGKVIYIAVLLLIPYLFATSDESPYLSAMPPVLHVFFFLTLIGTILNNSLFSPEKDMYYAVIIMRMDARKYAIPSYVFELGRHVIGYFVVIGILRLTFRLELNPLWLFVLPLFVAGAKIIVSYLQLLLFRKKGKIFAADEPSYTAAGWITIIVLFLAAYVPMFIGFIIPEKVLLGLCLAFIAGGIVCAIPLFGAKDYRPVLRYVAAKTSFASGTDIQAAANEAVKKNYMQKISEDDLSNMDETATGYRLFNKLFVRRHRRMLFKTPARIALGAAVLFLGLVVACLILKNNPNIEFVSAVNERMTRITPIMVFVMYLVNRGQTITQIMFFNCDSAMLGYNVYRRADIILGVFKERLKTVTLLNLLPAGVIAVGLPLILFVSGGTDNPIEYLILFVSIIAMSVFFSVHYLTMYYLFQPFTQGLVNKSPVYRIIMALTYLVCYAAFQIRTSSIIFAVVVVAFALVYIPVALALTYKFAPRRFRLIQ